MRIDLAGRRFRLLGATTPVAAAAAEALGANGATDAGDPTLLLVSFPLLPTEASPGPLLAEAEAAVAAMPEGRAIFLLPAAAGLPMRRHPGFSAAMAAALATVRTLAMRRAPAVLVNAVGLGAIGDPLVAGDAAMLGHAAVGRPGTLAEAVAAVLFLADPMNSYTTGQLLSVDGGWSAGYGRNF